MPDIPNLPGVPQLSSFSANPIVLLVEDVVSLITGLSAPTWAILLNGQQAFPYQSIVDVDFKQDNPTSDYPVEEGGFLSYDKVQLPFDVKVRITSYSDDASRSDLLTQVKAASLSLELYDIVTPDETISNCNITHVDYKRASENGVSMILIDIWFIEIRQTSTSNFTSTASPTIAGQQSSGNVAPQDAPADFDTRFNAAGGSH